MSGVVAAFSLFDLCQFLMLNRKTGTLTVRSENHAAYLTFQDGQLFNALDDAFRDGEGVVLQAVQWTEGTFEFSPGPIPQDRHIHASTENILLEAARQVDELRCAEGEAESEGAAKPSLQAAFRETQRRAGELAEVFQRAVVAGAGEGVRATWKDTVLKALRTGEAVRAQLGPGARVGLLGPRGFQEVQGAPQSEVEEWMNELVPLSRAQGPGAARGHSGPRVSLVPEGGRLWAIRRGTPAGNWIALSMPPWRLPSWADLGLTPEQFIDLERVNRGVVLLASPSSDLAAAALAAWLRKRAEHRAEVAWIVESWPHYDWEALAGRCATLLPGSVAEPGALSTLAAATGASVVAVLGVRDPRLLRDALALSVQQAQVVIAAEADSVTGAIHWLETWSGRDDSTGECPVDLVAKIWLVQPGPEPSAVPVQSMLEEPPRLRAMPPSSRMSLG